VNSWKAALFHEFYERVKRALRRGLETPVDQDELMREHQDSARAQLRGSGMPPAAIERAWSKLPTVYFLRHSPEEIARHTRALAAAGEANADEALVSVEPQSELGTTAVMIYAPHRRHGSHAPRPCSISSASTSWRRASLRLAMAFRLIPTCAGRRRRGQ